MAEHSTLTDLRKRMLFPPSFAHRRGRHNMKTLMPIPKAYSLGCSYMTIFPFWFPGTVS